MWASVFNHLEMFASGGILLLVCVVIFGFYAIHKSRQEDIPKVIEALAKLLPWHRRDKKS